MNGVTLLFAIIASPDVQEFDVQYRGKCSWFQATNNSALLHPLAFIPRHYCACRWRYDNLARALHIERREIKEYLSSQCVVHVLNPANGRTVEVTPIDWGPARKTGRAIDLDKASLEALGAETDDELRFELRRVR